MFEFRRPRRWRGLLPDRKGWFSVYKDGKRIGFVRRQAAGRWIGAFSRGLEDGKYAVIAATRDAAAEALQWRIEAGAQGTGQL